MYFYLYCVYRMVLTIVELPSLYMRMQEKQFLLTYKLKVEEQPTCTRMYTDVPIYQAACL